MPARIPPSAPPRRAPADHHTPPPPPHPPPSRPRGIGSFPRPPPPPPRPAQPPRGPPVGRPREHLTRRRPSNVQVADFAGVLHDELPARFDLFAHQCGEDPLRLLCLGNRHALQRPHLRVHRRLPELLWVHLGQALVALDLHLLAAGLQLAHDDLPLVVRVGILPFLARLDQVERRLGDVDLAALDQWDRVAGE